MIIVRIHTGNPSVEDWIAIGTMLEEGYRAGIDQPSGINWTVEWVPGSNLKGGDDGIEETTGQG